MSRPIILINPWLSVLSVPLQIMHWFPVAWSLKSKFLSIIQSSLPDLGLPPLIVLPPAFPIADLAKLAVPSSRSLIKPRFLWHPSPLHALPYLVWPLTLIHHSFQTHWGAGISIESCVCSPSHRHHCLQLGHSSSNARWFHCTYLPIYLSLYYPKFPEGRVAVWFTLCLVHCPQCLPRFIRQGLTSVYSLVVQ